MKTPDILPAVTIREATIVSGFSRATIYRLIAEGQFPGYRTPRGVSIPRLWFLDWQCGRWTPPARDATSIATATSPSLLQTRKVS